MQKESRAWNNAFLYNQKPKTKTNMKTLKTILLMLAVGLTASAQRYVGGDISCLTLNEEKNPTWLDANGNTTTPLQLFKDEGLNAMRVRLFVEPDNYTASDKDANACQDLDYVKALGKRIKDAGFKLLLDFHYSDTWADPAKQWTPADWASLGDDALYEKIYTYTKDVLTEMKAAGAEPELIQTGNEISYGMLWGAYGSTSLKKCYMGNDANWERFTTLLKQAAKACREVCPEAKIILHTERAEQTNVLTNFYDRMASAKVDYDVIGLSYYPIWHGEQTTLDKALTTLETRYTDKQIMIVETGAAYSWLPDSKDHTPSYAATEAGQQQFTQDLITLLKKHEKVTGLFWWWMEYNAYPWATTKMDGWWYAPLIDSNTGKPLAAMHELKNFLVTDGINAVERNCIPETDKRWFTLSGQPVDGPTQSGIYIQGGQKKAVRY